jgi:hypothetical protein
MSLDNYRDVLNTTNPGHNTAWPTNPARRPNAWARWRERLFGPDPQGADSTWLNQMRTAASQLDDDTRTGRHYADNIATTVMRRPIAAIAATPHHACVDEHLGPLDLEPDEATPFHDAIARWAAAGYPIDDQTTDTTGEKDQ